MLKREEESAGGGRGKPSSKLAAYWAHCIDVSVAAAAAAFIVVLVAASFCCSLKYASNLMPIKRTAGRGRRLRRRRVGRGE